MDRRRREDKKGNKQNDSVGVLVAAGAVGALLGGLLSYGISRIWDSTEEEKPRQRQPAVAPSAPPAPPQYNTTHRSSRDCPDELDEISSFLCPITHEVMTDPVMCSCHQQHSFERSAILDWLKTHRTCPMSNEPLTATDLQRCPPLKRAIEEYTSKSRR
eukprot:GILJ01001752.1.p1 GENE.GILJ01001752.1~~GILJ01001752.1.p1  ORF type:complete len:159 (+),score=10.58 GILJ01001752.1:37-513(+)